MNDDINQENKTRQKNSKDNQKNPVWKATQNKDFFPSFFKYTMKSTKSMDIISFPLGRNCKPLNGKRHSKEVG